MSSAWADLPSSSQGGHLLPFGSQRKRHALRGLLCIFCQRQPPGRAPWFRHVTQLVGYGVLAVTGSALRGVWTPSVWFTAANRLSLGTRGMTAVLRVPLPPTRIPRSQLSRRTSTYKTAAGKDFLRCGLNPAGEKQLSLAGDTEPLRRARPYSPQHFRLRDAQARR